MKFLLVLLLAAAPLTPSRAAEKPARESKEKAGPVSWLWQHLPIPKFGGKAKPGANWNDLRLTLSVQPPQPKLPETKRLSVALQLTNSGKKFMQLEFPTSQRIEVLVKDESGKVLEKWSEDQAFNDEATVVTINPGERLEYTAIVSTREMATGRAYAIEGFLPRYDKLRVSKTVRPGN